MDWAQILVIILAVFLALFLLLGIVLTAMLIRITKQIKSVTNSAQRTVDHFEHMVAGASRLTSPMFFIGLVKKIIKRKK